MIRFACPSGHPLTAPDHLAGKPGKCPKCQATFVIPANPSGSAGGGSGVAVATSAAAEASGSAVTPAAGSGTGLAQGDIFVFLCPNGHKLHGPPSLKGKPGQCPHCGARFLIPTDEDLADQPSEPPTTEETPEPSGRERSAEPGIDFDRLLASHERSDELAQYPLAGPAGLGQIVGRLWTRRTPQAELEIYLNEGEILTPDYFAPQLSTSDYGVFGVREGDGRYGVTIVPWSAVRRVCLRRMDGLPGDLFAP
jgi:hypothetical protein